MISFKHANEPEKFAQVVEVLKRAALEAPVPLTITSSLRSAGANKQAGGVPNSYHKSGQAIDIRTRDKSREEIAALTQHFSSKGFDVINEGDHLHIEPGNGQVRSKGHSHNEVASKSPGAPRGRPLPEEKPEDISAFLDNALAFLEPKKEEDDFDALLKMMLG